MHHHRALHLAAPALHTQEGLVSCHGVQPGLGGRLHNRKVLQQLPKTGHGLCLEGGQPGCRLLLLPLLLQLLVLLLTLLHLLPVLKLLRRGRGRPQHVSDEPLAAQPIARSHGRGGHGCRSARALPPTAGTIIIMS